MKAFLTRAYKIDLPVLIDVTSNGYDISTDELIQRPDAVTISTVHKMRGLDFPCVLIVDPEQQRFPSGKSSYDGVIPEKILNRVLERGAYQNIHNEERWRQRRVFLFSFVLYNLLVFHPA